MDDLKKVIVRRKWIFLFFLILGFGGVLLIYRLHTHLAEASVTVRILERKNDSKTPLLISKTKEIISPFVMEKAVLKLGWTHPGDSAEKVQKKILILQKAVFVFSEGNGIVQIWARNASGKTAIQMANTIAEAYEEMDRVQGGAETRQFQDFLQRNIQKSEKRIRELETEIYTFERESPPTDVVASLKQDLEKATAGRQRLMKVFTEKHPEVVKLDEEIAHLQSDLDALPQPKGDINALQAELAQTKEASHAFSNQLQEAAFKLAEETGSVRILRRAATSRPVRNPIKFSVLLVAVCIGVLMGYSAALAAERFFSKASY